MLQAGLSGDVGHGDGVVPGDDLQVHPLVGEVPQGAGGLPADFIADEHQPQQPQLAGERLAVEVLLALGQQQNTLPLLGVALHLLPDGGKALAQDKLPGAHDESAPAREERAAPLPGGGEGHQRAGPPGAGLGVALLDGLEGGVAVLQVGHQAI